MSDQELTCDAKAAIRAYIIKLVTLPAIIVSILSFLLGFSIQEGATARALSDALKQVMPRITDATQAAANATASAEQTKVAANKTFTELQQLDALQKALQQKDALVAEVTRIITPDIKKAIQQSLGSATEKMDIYSKKQRGEALDLTCPPGTYMSGVSIALQSGGAHGQVYSVIPIYKPFIPLEETKKP